jgi:hypothetical protein
VSPLHPPVTSPPIGGKTQSRNHAQHGYATLQVAYFDAPGRPKDLGLIPLEYFKTAFNIRPGGPTSGVPALWPSCPMSEQVVARLKAEHFKPSVQLLEYPDAGHAVFGQPLDPNSPRFADLAKEGGSAQGKQAARQDSWARALAFLDGVLKAVPAKAHQKQAPTATPIKPNRWRRILRPRAVCRFRVAETEATRTPPSRPRRPRGWAALRSNVQSCDA